MEWTTERPRINGWYWVTALTLDWNKDERSTEPEVWCVNVEVATVHGEPYLDFIAPVDGYEWEWLIDPKHITHWMGPLSQPEPPQL